MISARRRRPICPAVEIHVAPLLRCGRVNENKQPNGIRKPRPHDRRMQTIAHHMVVKPRGVKGGQGRQRANRTVNWSAIDVV